MRGTLRLGVLHETFQHRTPRHIPITDAQLGPWGPPPGALRRVPPAAHVPHTPPLTPLRRGLPLDGGRILALLAEIAGQGASVEMLGAEGRPSCRLGVGMSFTIEDHDVAPRVLPAGAPL